MSGLKIAALYSLRPHQLGLCGPKEALKQQILKKFLQGKISSAKVRKILERFRGAYSYYQLIAKSNKIKDQFDGRVIKAYWIGNQLLNKVKIRDLGKMIADEFSGPGLLSKEVAVKKAKTIPASSKPHHSFHVFMIGSVTGSVDLKSTRLKNLCRIGWGKIIKIKSLKFPPKADPPLAEKVKSKRKLNKILVEYQPLVGRKIIRLGKPIKKEVIWDKEIVPEVKIGDWVSFHWDQLVQVLTKEDLANLKKYTLNTLNSLL